MAYEPFLEVAYNDLRNAAIRMGTDALAIYTWAAKTRQNNSTEMLGKLSLKILNEIKIIDQQLEELESQLFEIDKPKRGPKVTNVEKRVEAEKRRQSLVNFIAVRKLERSHYKSAINDLIEE
ncbi:hypothetical protein NQZ79_g8350 [Umbelopsis isabellina]|nr:hypothetical protein NQZ79_g8350 [Umbelopsis isabellina]